MSTRCQVKVVGDNDLDNVMLYHHCDGYPSNMLPLIYRAYKYGIKPKALSPGGEKYDMSWMARRAGHCASFLCHMDPTEFEPESGFDLHGDIEYYYVLYVSGNLSEWRLKIFVPKNGVFWDDPCFKNMNLLLEENSICELVNKKNKLRAEVINKIDKRGRELREKDEERDSINNSIKDILQ